MVLGVCRRVLRNDHDADDAFQAAFLVLARKAGSVRGESLAGWLHRVARRVAVRAAKRSRPESLSFDPPAQAEPDAELRAVLDAEIDRLPDRLRLPVVLCYLDGRSTEDAARQLGIPRGTVLSRLAAARAKLAERLTRQGITAGVFAAGFVTEALTANAVEGCTAAALRFAAGLGGTGIPIQLAEGVLRMGTRIKLAGWALALVMVAGLGTGVGVMAGNTPEVEDGAKKPDPTPTEQAKLKPANPPRQQDDDRQEKLRQRAEERELAEQRAIDRADRLSKLDKQAKKLEEVIAKQMDQLSQLHHEAAAQVDIKALQTAMAKADDAILELEESIESAKASREEKQQSLGAVNKLVPKPDQIDAVVNLRGDVRKAVSEYYDARQAVDKLKQTTPPDNPTLRAAQKEMKDKAAQLEAVRLASRPEAEKTWREEQALALRNAIAANTSYLQETEKKLRSTVAKRQHLAERYARAKQTTDRIQLIEDELKVYREVRQTVIRQRLLMEIGLDDGK
jgi:RNA polymerase sigma factor (sigma-70 family)